MPNRTFSLRCGNKTLSLTVPEGVRFQYAPLREVTAPSDAAQVIRDALDAPAGSPRIEEMVKPGQRVCIISDDNTRNTPVDLILKELLPRLHGAGIRKEDVFIVFALGSHRYMTREEMIDKVGADVAARYALYNSAFEDAAQLVEVGKSEMGTPIRVFSKAMEADIRIGIGNVTPHGCMGWSGGAKILYPGITSADIVSEFHTMQGLREEILFGMVEAPTRLAVESWTEAIGLHFIVNTVLDLRMQPYRAVAGHYIKAHRRAVSYAQDVFGVQVEEAPDIIVSVAYPFYMDFWQCGKAAYGPAAIIRPGGELLLLADCAEGVGPHPDMLRNMADPHGPARLQAQVEAHQTGEELLSLAVGVSMGRIVRRCRTTLITDGLSAEECARGAMEHCPTAKLQFALDAALARAGNAGRDPFLLIIPEAGEAVPELRRP